MPGPLTLHPLTLQPIHNRVFRLILSCASCYFGTLFGCSKWDESGNQTVKISESICSGRILKILVEFAYSQSFVVGADDAFDLLVAADYYGFLSVIEECTNYIEHKLSHENCIAIWKFATRYNFWKLEQIVFDFILRDIKDICGSDDFYNLEEAEFNQIIINEWLNADDLEIQEATDAWYKHR